MTDTNANALDCAIYQLEGRDPDPAKALALIKTVRDNLRDGTPPAPGEGVESDDSESLFVVQLDDFTGPPLPRNGAVLMARAFLESFPHAGPDCLDVNGRQARALDYFANGHASHYAAGMPDVGQMMVSPYVESFTVRAAHPEGDWMDTLEASSLAHVLAIAPAYFHENYGDGWELSDIRVVEVFPGRVSALFYDAEAEPR